MHRFINSFKHQVSQHPHRCALKATGQSISYAQLANEIGLISQYFRRDAISTLAVALPNSPAWVALDLAAVFSGVTLIPVPHFFSPAQRRHLFDQANIDALITTDNAMGEALAGSVGDGNKSRFPVFDHDFLLYRPRQSPQGGWPSDTLKISFTSGSTGNPKGVLISAQQIDRAVASLVKRIAASHADRHLNALPFSLLLENIAGVYAVLASGAQCLIPSFAELGLDGSSRLDAEKFLQTIIASEPTTMITVPAMAQALVSQNKNVSRPLKSLRFVAVGGGALSASVIRQAMDLALPLYQGYGLTECNSVVTLNTPGQNKPGSVGKPLSHIDISISSDNEILVAGASFLGYLNQTEHPAGMGDGIWHTGDLGYLDDDGFLFVTGRKSTTYATAFGRNISPEWIEGELVARAPIRQAIVYGEGKPFNLAIIVSHGDSSSTRIQAAIEDTNSQLPDYARIGGWLKASEPFSTANQQLSGNGTIQRHRILDKYRLQINQTYQQGKPA